MNTIICIATGPSLTQDDVDYCRGKARVFVVNDAYKIAPWADLLYAADTSWWKHHKGCPEFKGERWTCSDAAAMTYGLRHIPVKQADWSDNPAFLAGGGNSGFQTLNKAVHAEPDRILLLGYDYGFKPGTKKEPARKHFFGEHPPELDRVSNFREWIKRLNKAAGQIKIPVINCTRETAIKCFPRENLRDVI